MTRHSWVAAQIAAGFPVIMACTTAGISVSWFYEICQRKPTAAPMPSTRVDARGVSNAELVALIREIFAKFDGTYGFPRMRAWLRLNAAVVRRRVQPVNRMRVARLMGYCGLIGRHHPRKIRTTIPSSGPGSIPDLVGRGFAPAAPDVA